MRKAALGLLVMVAAVLAAAEATAAASPNRLIAPSVSPTAGTTDTAFTFSVRYRSQAGSSALSVSVSVAGLTVPLVLSQGTAVDGVYTGTSTLPIGTWTATFEAIAEAGTNPTASAGPIQVTAPATPTPVPTAPPPPPPPPTPTPVAPAPAGPVAPDPGVATPATTSSSSPLVGVAAGGLSEPSAPANLQGDASGLLPDGDGATWVVLGGLALVAMVAGVGAFWVIGEHRRGEADWAPAEVTAESSLRMSAAPPPLASRPDRRAPAAWELDSALDDEPIGTVDLLPSQSRANVGDLPLTVSAGGSASSEPADGLNAGTRRVAEMHGWRDGSERRTVRRRRALMEEAESLDH